MATKFQVLNGWHYVPIAWIRGAQQLTNDKNELMLIVITVKGQEFLNSTVPLDQSGFAGRD